MYRPVSWPSAATSVSGPIGLSTTTCVCMALLSGQVIDDVVSGSPQVLDRVGPPWPPGGRAIRQRQRVAGQPGLTGARADAEVGCWESVRIAKGPHGDRLDGPRAKP